MFNLFFQKAIVSLCFFAFSFLFPWNIGLSIKFSREMQFESDERIFAPLFLRSTLTQIVTSEYYVPADNFRNRLRECAKHGRQWTWLAKYESKAARNWQKYSLFVIPDSFHYVRSEKAVRFFFLSNTRNCYCPKTIFHNKNSIFQNHCQYVFIYIYRYPYI